MNRTALQTSRQPRPADQRRSRLQRAAPLPISAVERHAADGRMPAQPVVASGPQRCAQRLVPATISKQTIPIYSIFVPYSLRLRSSCPASRPTIPITEGRPVAHSTPFGASSHHRARSCGLAQSAFSGTGVAPRLGAPPCSSCAAPLREKTLFTTATRTSSRSAALSPMLRAGHAAVAFAAFPARRSDLASGRPLTARCAELRRPSPWAGLFCAGAPRPLFGPPPAASTNSLQIDTPPTQMSRYGLGCGPVPLAGPLA